MAETKTTQNAATLGLGFHQFDGNVNVKDVIEQIGANFTVREDSLVRLPKEILEAAQRGESVTINPNWLINTHKATVHDGFDDTIGIVGKDYGVIQNTNCFDLLDMMCNASVTENPLKIVSAGMTSNYDPYIQAVLPTSARIDGDKSDTQFYVFAHTSHDGTSGLQIRFSPVRVICRNTFMANVNSRLGMTFKHSKNAASRVDLTQEANIKRVQEMVANLNFLQTDYIEKMNHFKTQRVSDEFVEEYILDLFVKKDKEGEELRRAARAVNYNLDLTEASTRTKNIIESFKNTLYSDDKGQDFAAGTKLWLFNGTTNYTSNVMSFGSQKDSDKIRSEKRFESMLDGTANKKVNLAFDLLAA